jgi:hypothetical protein
LADGSVCPTAQGFTNKWRGRFRLRTVHFSE